MKIIPPNLHLSEISLRPGTFQILIRFYLLLFINTLVSRPPVAMSCSFFSVHLILYAFQHFAFQEYTEVYNIANLADKVLQILWISAWLPL